MKSSPAAVGVFGGSFDPVHQAHLTLVTEFARELSLDEVLLMPAGQPWQKGALGASAADRVAMLRLGLATLAPQHCAMRIDEREINRAGPSYTIDTLKALRSELGSQTSLVLLIGADQFLRLDTWRHWTELFELAHIAVASRPGSPIDELPAAVERQWTQRRADCSALPKQAAGKICLLNHLHLPPSATAIRALLRHSQPGPQRSAALTPGLLPAMVLDYIDQNNLYKN